MATILRTEDAECADLSGRDLSAEEQVMAEAHTFSGVSFRGANLRDTVFPPYGAPNWHTPLQGADIRGAIDIYGMSLAGVIDAHTRFDETCQVTEDESGQRHVDCPPPPP